MRYSPPSTQVLLISPRKLAFLYMVVSYSGLSYQYRLAPPAKKVVIKEIFVFKFSIDPVAVGRGQFFPQYPQIAFGNQMPTKVSATDAPSTAG